MAKDFRVTVKFKDGSCQYVTVRANDADDARRQVERHQYRRQERGGLTFARLEQAKETGQPGMLAVDPRFGGQALTEAWIKAETERRKRDLGRYDSDFTIDKVGEAPK